VAVCLIYFYLLSVTSSFE